MDRKIVWTERASTDIEAIVRYIGRRDPDAARNIGLGIYESVQILNDNPEAGPKLNELPGTWRKLTFRRWKIIYTLHYDTMIIARVWPAALGEINFEHPL
jgi:plasmid stabilization system protein ParE